MIHLHLFVSIDYGSSCEAIKKIPLSCISSVDLASSLISSVNVDQDGKVDIKFISTLKPNLYQYLLQSVYVSDSGNQTTRPSWWLMWPTSPASHLGGPAATLGQASSDLPFQPMTRSWSSQTTVPSPS